MSDGPEFPRLISAATANPLYCRASKFSNYRRHQCFNKATKEWAGVMFCGRCFPPTVHARQEVRQAKWDAERAAAEESRHQREAAAALAVAAVDGIRRIAAGHNDPRSLAQEILEEFDK